MRAIIPVLCIFLVSCTSKTKQAETVNLFNGSDLKGWHMDIPAMDQNPDTTKAFIVRDGMLVSLGDPRGHLITDAGQELIQLTRRHLGQFTVGVVATTATFERPKALPKAVLHRLALQRQDEPACQRLSHPDRHSPRCL